MPARVPFVFRKTILPLVLGGVFAGLFTVRADAQNAAATPPPFEYVPVKRAGFLEKLFKKKPAATPTPATAAAPATPKPTPRKKKKTPIASADTPAPASSPSSTPADSETPNGEPTPQANIESTVPATDTPTVGSNVGDRLPDSLPPLSAEGNITIPPPASAAAPAATPFPQQSLPEAPVSEAPVVTTSAPPTQAVRNNPLNQPIPLLSDSAGSETVSVPSPEALREKENTERLQFRKIKARALEDATLQKLQQATETAATPEDRYAALKKFYPKLFASMRKLDASLSVQIDEMEAASRRRLERMETDAAAK